MRKSVFALTGTLIFCLTAVSFALTIKLGSLAPTASPWDDALREIAADWQKVSGGKVNLKIYAGGVAGDEEDMIRKMKIGQLNAAGMTGVGMCRIYSGVLAIQLPLLIRTDEELFHVIEKMAPVFEKALAEKGFKILVWTKVGWVHFFSKEPVVYPQDLKKQKQFMWAGDADGIQAWKDAGFKPVPLQVTDMMTALQSGMVEAFSATPLSAASYQWFGLAKNMCGMRWAPLVGGIVVNQSTWKKINPELRAKLEKSIKRIGSDMQENIDKADAQAIEVMRENGLVVHDVPPEAVAQWEKVTEVGFSKLAGKSFDKKCFEMIKQILKEYRETDAK